MRSHDFCLDCGLTICLLKTDGFFVPLCGEGFVKKRRKTMRRKRWLTIGITLALMAGSSGALAAENVDVQSGGGRCL